MKKFTFIVIALFMMNSAFSQALVSLEGENNPVVYQISKANLVEKVACDFSNPGNAFENGHSNPTYLNRIAANDIMVAADEDFTLEQVIVYIFSTSAIVDLNLFYYEDDGAGGIGTQIGTETGIVPTTATIVGANFGYDVYECVLDITPFTFAGSAGVETTYWIGSQCANANGDNVFSEVTSATMVGGPDWYFDGTVWAILDPTLDGVYIYSGQCDPWVTPAVVTFIVDNTANTSFTGFALKGSWDASGNYDAGWNGGAEHTMFYDDGTNGDVTAGDDMWTCMYNLVPDAGANTWEWGVNDQNGDWIDGNWQFTVPDETAQTLTYATVGLNTISAENINIYPNPSNGTFNVNVESSYDLEVLDITGKVINTQVLTGNSTVEINTAGVYFLRFSNEEGSVTQRVIVQ